MTRKIFVITRALMFFMVIDGVVGCSGSVPVKDDVLAPNAALPSITVRVPNGAVEFPINTRIPLCASLKLPLGQGKPTLIARLKKGGSIASEASLGEPTQSAEDEWTYEAAFATGVPRKGNYQVVVEGIMTLPVERSAKSPKAKPEAAYYQFFSNTVPLKVAE